MAVSISRPRFDMLVSGILRKAEALLRSFIPTDECSEKLVEFDVVLLAGNVCDMPSATTLIRTKLFPNAHSGRGDVPADEAVAIGCARQAASVLSCPTHSKSGGKKIGGEDCLVISIEIKLLVNVMSLLVVGVVRELINIYYNVVVVNNPGT